MPNWLSRNRIIVACAAFAILLPCLAFLGDLQFPVAIGLSLVSALGLYFLLASNTPDVEINSSTLDASQRELARKILSEALTDVDRLMAVGKRIKTARVKQQVSHLSDLFNKTIAEVTREPERLTSVRRLLTFYAPKAADIAEGYLSIEQAPRPDAMRLNRAEVSLRKLDEAWAHFTDKLAEPDRTNLDIELDVLDQSLKTDLERLPWR
jgi:5-bromo-4-chloroindolyl phosphate hydrolysis protein